MIIAVSSTGESMDSKVNPRFGRCEMFVVVDTSKDSHQVVSNSAVSNLSGAAVDATRLLTEHKVDAVVAGQFGPHALSALAASGIEAYAGVDDSTSVKDAVSLVTSGKLAPTNTANRPK